MVTRHNTIRGHAALAGVCLACLCAAALPAWGKPLRELTYVYLEAEGKKYPLEDNGENGQNGQKTLRFLQRRGVSVYLWHGAQQVLLGTIDDDVPIPYAKNMFGDVLYGNLMQEGADVFFLTKMFGDRNAYYALVDASGKAVPLSRVFTETALARVMELFAEGAGNKSYLANPFINAKEGTLELHAALGPFNTIAEFSLNSNGRWQEKEDFVPYKLGPECYVARRGVYDAAGKASVLVVTDDESRAGFDFDAKYRVKGYTYSPIALLEAPQAGSPVVGRLPKWQPFVVEDITGAELDASWVKVTGHKGATGWVPVGAYNNDASLQVVFCVR